jgi:hypothetical protein
MPAQTSLLRNTLVMRIVSACRGADGKIPIVRRRVVGAGPATGAACATPACQNLQADAPPPWPR